MLNAIMLSVTVLPRMGATIDIFLYDCLFN
jgi:hypothetical protein